MAQVRGFEYDAGHAAAEFGFDWHDWPTLSELKSLWQELPGGAVSTPFQTPEFLHAFSRNVAAQTCERFTVLGLHGEASDGPVMLLPLVWSRKGPFRIVSFPDFGLSDQNGPILSKRFASVSNGRMPDLVSSLTRQLPQCDVLKICKISATIEGCLNPLFTAAEATLHSQNFSLDADCLQHVGSSKKSVFKQARTKFRKLEREGVTLFEATNSQEREVICSALLEQRKQREDAAGDANTIGEGFRADFFKALAGLKSQTSPVVALALRKGEEIIAAVVLLVSGSNANGVLVSIGDPRWHRQSPGMVLFVKSMEWARDNGIRNFSLGAGLQGYKHRFGGALQDTRKLWVPMNFSGRTYLTALHAKKMAEAMLEKAGTKP